MVAISFLSVRLISWIHTSFIGRLPLYADHCIYLYFRAMISLRQDVMAFIVLEVKNENEY